jgi:hypothetical protein
MNIFSGYTSLRQPLRFLTRRGGVMATLEQFVDQLEGLPCYRPLLCLVDAQLLCHPGESLPLPENKHTPL